MNKIKLFFSVTIIMSFLGCGLDKMASDYDKVVYEQTPTVLEVHGSQVSVDLNGTFPEKYFAKKATIEITPVIIDENGGESKLKSIILQGEQATGGDATIFFESGGEFTYSDKIDYTDEMINSTLELRALATLEDKSKVLGPVTIASGVIATSMRVQNDEIIAVADHGYKEIETTSETATIYFLVNKSNIRTTEKSDEDVKKLKEFIKLGYKTESFVVKSSASPEGTEKINTELSDDRQNSTLSYAKYLLKKLRADGSSDDDNYKLSSAGADWDGFNKLVENSTIAEKSTILSLSNRNKEKSEKERGELLQDMAQVYDALEGDVLQYLRKSEITINSYLPKRSKEEIMNLAIIEKKVPLRSNWIEDSIDINGDIVYSQNYYPYQINPEITELDVTEALYAASLLSSDDSRAGNWLELMDTIGVVFEDWRAYNNIAAYLMEDRKRTTPFVFDAEWVSEIRGDSLPPSEIEDAEGTIRNYYEIDWIPLENVYGGDSVDHSGNLVTQKVLYLVDSGYLSYGFSYELNYEDQYKYLNKARELGGDQPEILINLGILAAWEGDLNKAEEFFTKANATNHNKAILSIRQGDYRSASRYYRGQKTYNAALVNILNGNNIDLQCPTPEVYSQSTEGGGIYHRVINSAEIADCYYLHAVAAARSDNFEMVISNLKEAIDSDNPYYRYLASKDLEFEKYRDTEEFKSLFE